MKRMHYLLAGLIIPAMLTSCSSEDGVVETPIAPSDKDLPVVKLYANSGGSDTRTTIDGSGTVYWSQSDKINVNGQTSTNIELTPDRRTAIFQVLAKSPFAAVYPASVATKFDGNMFTLQVPKEQKHKDGGSFADDVNISVAYSETKEELNFKNVCGLLKATIKADAGATLSKIKKVRFNAGTGTGTYISGAAKLDPKTGVITFSGATNTYIDVVFDTPKTITGAEEIKVIWSLPPKTYSNWTIELVDETDNILKNISTISSTGSNPPITITRSVITPVTQVYPQYYTIEIKSDNATIVGQKKNWMYKGEKRTFKIKRIIDNHSFYKWTATPQEPGNDEMKEPTLIVTASNNQVFEALTIKGTLIPLYDDEGLNETGKKILFSLPLESDGVFFEDNYEGGGWSPLPLPSASKVKCPAGWRFPTPTDHISAFKFLMKEKFCANTTERYTFIWPPILTVDMNRRFFNVSPAAGTVIMNNHGSIIDPQEGYTFLDNLRPTDADGPYPVRCVKDFD